VLAKNFGARCHTLTIIKGACGDAFEIGFDRVQGRIYPTRALPSGGLEWKDTRPIYRRQPPLSMAEMIDTVHGHGSCAVGFSRYCSPHVSTSYLSRDTHPQVKLCKASEGGPIANMVLSLT
jgi:hypothetical protein